MGAVYRATDAKLDREVAIKVLPETFACEPERLSRFEREAKALAALNHPNIAGIYGLEKSGDSQALILELVEGEDLSGRLKRGPLPVEEALEVCKQIAEALEAAQAWAEDSNFGESQGLKEASPWKKFAVFLYCGKIYE